MPMPTALTLHNLTKTYSNGTEALKGISLAVEQGDFFALLGPNGAGKSTTIGIITTLLPKTGGDVEVFGHHIDNHLEEIKSSIGIVPQEFNFNFWETVENILYDQAGYYGISRRKAKSNVELYLKELGLWEKRKKVARSLSGGMKRRLMIARALVHDPDMIILDEPTAGVDIEIRRSMWKFMKKLNASGKTIILTTHYLEEAEQLCRNIAIINHGEIIRNTSMQNLLRETTKETYVFDVETTVSIGSVLKNFELVVIDEVTIEVTIHNGSELNPVFDYFNQHNIKINSMRNKSNRLESLFLELTKREKTT